MIPIVAPVDIPPPSDPGASAFIVKSSAEVGVARVSAAEIRCKMPSLVCEDTNVEKYVRAKSTGDVTVGVSKEKGGIEGAQLQLWVGVGATALGM
jgi:hypothetical protein